MQAGSGEDWLGLARGLLQLELPCQSRLPRLQPEWGLLRLPCLHPARGSQHRGACCSATQHLPVLCLLSPAPSELAVSCTGLRSMGTVSELCASSFQAFLCPSVAAKAGRRFVPSPLLAVGSLSP